MRTSMKLRMILAGWMALIATTCFAQKEMRAVENAFNKTVSALLQDDCVTWSEISNKKEAKYFFYEFSIPVNKKKIIESFNKAIINNTSKASNSVIKKSGTNDNKTITMSNNMGFRKDYDGHDCNCYAIEFLAGSNDMKDYALLWYTPKDGKIRGAIMKSNQIKLSSNNRGFYIPNGSDAQSSVIISNIKVPNQDEIDKVLEENKRLKQEKEEKQKRYYLYEPQTPEQFFAQFNNYCNIFKNTDKFIKEAKNNGKDLEKNTFQNVIANRLMKLCKNHINGNTSHDREYCRKSIQDLKKYTNDEGVKFILDQTIQYITH